MQRIESSISLRRIVTQQANYQILITTLNVYDLAFTDHHSKMAARLKLPFVLVLWFGCGGEGGCLRSGELVQGK